MFLGRTHIKSVAEERKGEVEEFLRFLFRLAPEIAQVRTKQYKKELGVVEFKRGVKLV